MSRFQIETFLLLSLVHSFGHFGHGAPVDDLSQFSVFNPDKNILEGGISGLPLTSLDGVKMRQREEPEIGPEELRLQALQKFDFEKKKLDFEEFYERKMREKEDPKKVLEKVVEAYKFYQAMKKANAIQTPPWGSNNENDPAFPYNQGKQKSNDDEGPLRELFNIINE